MKLIKHYRNIILLWGFSVFYQWWVNSIFGECIMLLTFESYKNNIRYIQRSRVFGPKGAVKMFTSDEYEIIKNETWENHKWKILLNPFMIIWKFRDKDSVLKDTWITEMTKDDSYADENGSSNPSNC